MDTFDQDLLISYAHIDNSALKQGEEGWISEFHRALQIRLSQLLGEKAKIWRDPKLKGNDVFSDEIIDQFPQIALLVSILSPRYVNSEWCLRELNTFLESSAPNIGLKVNNKSRIFKVVKTPIERERLPQELQEVLGYEFFKIDQNTGNPKEFSSIFGVETERNFWDKLDDLAHDICHMLQEMQHQDQPVNGQQLPPETQPKQIIFLAESSQDLRDEREQIKRELLAHGYKVLPEQNLPFYQPDLNEQLKKDLAVSGLSIHLIGANYGVVPEGGEKSMAVIQNELAIDQANEGDLSRIIWLKEQRQPDDFRQLEFIQDIKNNGATQAKTELLETSLSELKFCIQDMLTDEPKSESKPIEKQTTTRQLYIICRPNDLLNEELGKIEDFFFEHGIDVILPVFEGEEEAVRMDYIENLKQCDAVFIYYNDPNQLWLRSKVRDLLKIMGYGRSQPLTNKCIYMTGEVGIRLQDTDIIDGTGGFRPELLQAILKKIMS